jgi:hypothetical protein
VGSAGGESGNDRAGNEQAGAEKEKGAGAVFSPKNERNEKEKEAADPKNDAD